MPRAASRKTSKKPVAKITKASVGSPAEKGLAKALKQLDVQTAKLGTVREKLRAKRVSVAAKPTKANTASLEKIYILVANQSAAAKEADKAVRMAKAELRVEKVLARSVLAKAAIEEKQGKVIEKQVANTALDLEVAKERFEKRWLKLRESQNSKNSKLLTAKSKLKINAIERKSELEIKAIRKRSNRVAAMTVKAPGRPGRPSGSAQKVSAAPKNAPAKKRGRPASNVVKSDEAPKRRGRPPKAAVAKAVSSQPVAVKRRGRPAKAKADTVKADTVKLDVVKKAEGTAPAKRRGRPPKAEAGES